MAKKLCIKNAEKCSGCELCIMEAQRQLGVVGLEDSLIRIFRDREIFQVKPKYNIEMDPRIHSLDIEKIMTICPNGVFEIIEEKE